MCNDSRKMQAEEKYIAGDCSLKALAEEMGLPYGTVKKWSAGEDWQRKRKAFQTQAMKKAAAKAVNKKARELARLLEASEEMESALLLAARAFTRKMEEEENPEWMTDGKNPAGNLTAIIRALGQQTENRMLLSGMMKEGGGKEETSFRVEIAKEAEDLAE